MGCSPQIRNRGTVGGNPDELITAVHLPVRAGPQQFARVGTRNAMVIAVCSFAIAAGRRRAADDRVRAGHRRGHPCRDRRSPAFPSGPSS